jgi:hypothetical protein
MVERTLVVSLFFDIYLTTLLQWEFFRKLVYRHVFRDSALFKLMITSSLEIEESSLWELIIFWAIPRLCNSRRRPFKSQNYVRVYVYEMIKSGWTAIEICYDVAWMYLKHQCFLPEFLKQRHWQHEQRISFSRQTRHILSSWPSTCTNLK